MIVNPYILKLVQYSFILLWGSAAVLKLWDRELTKREMEMQVFLLCPQKGGGPARCSSCYRFFRKP